MLILEAHSTTWNRPRPFDFGDRPLRRDPVRPGSSDRRRRVSWHVPPAAILFVQRKISGTAILTARLGARVDVRALIAIVLGEGAQAGIREPSQAKHPPLSLGVSALSTSSIRSAAQSWSKQALGRDIVLEAFAEIAINRAWLKSGADGFRSRPGEVDSEGSHQHVQRRL